jgi:hypothetical protein
LLGFGRSRRHSSAKAEQFLGKLPKIDSSPGLIPKLIEIDVMHMSMRADADCLPMRLVFVSHNELLFIVTTTVESGEEFEDV